MSNFEKELWTLINTHSMENGSNTPDWILARYLSNCLAAFNEAVNTREGWYGRQISEKFTELPSEEQ